MPRRNAREHGGFLRSMGITLVGLVIVALGGLVLYLLSDINHRRYRLALEGDVLTVEQGRFFPVGFVPFAPSNPVLQQAYAPIRVPQGEPVEVGIPFDDRSEVDRALYARLSSWARTRLSAQDAPTLALGIDYVKRLEALPGLSESQRQALRGMRADAALRQAEGLMQGIPLTLHHAASLFALSLELGTMHVERARAGLAHIDDKLRRMGDAPLHVEQNEPPSAAATPPDVVPEGASEAPAAPAAP